MIDFIDLKAAYDKVDREIMWKKCHAKGIEAAPIKLPQTLFGDNKAFVAINGSFSEPFPLLSGLLRGSVLSSPKTLPLEG